ncbi:thiol reductant ABC exporter subunit CydC [Bacillus sp. RG28]|uniref:Thiol reductant ABC exporter subunit CydC n=1 Tax=Gottfriedia endophytica TaxID=2820819 RepID=A0A940NVM7_9BACI|nr:thiol reductant ABC exporter subunit CydC [Gottfriedia endophytica]MBP0725758.1 thiol reductant ABC exporter subunit CydC [Gottfriedia endophytica]
MFNKNGWILPYIKENRRLFILVIFLSALTIFAAASLMYTSGFLISKAATRPENILMIYVPIVAVRTFGILRSVSKYTERLVGHNTILKILSHMRTRLFSILEPSALSLSSKFKTGDILGLLANDIEYLQDIYLKTIFPGIAVLFIYVLSIFVMGFFSIPFALLIALVSFVLIGILPFYSLLVEKARTHQIKNKKKILYENLTDAVMGISDWLFSGRKSSFFKNYKESDHSLRKLQNQEKRFRSWRDFFAQFVVAILVLMMLYWAGNESIVGEIPKTFIAAFVLVLFPLTEAFIPLSNSVGSVPLYNDSINRLEDLEENHQTSTTSFEFDRKVEEFSKVEFENVTFQYSVEGNILNNISFTLEPNKITALLGPSGSGKSTILKLIEGVEAPKQGRVTINNIETRIVGDAISNVVSVLNQKPYLFDTSVLNNIRLGNPKASDDEVVKVAKMVELHDYIESLPQGYHTPMEETGVRFSGGERQRIALARVLLQFTPIVILDEPTVGLDSITERKLLNTIFKVLEGKTVLWITHHLIGSEMADQILFLDQGKIIMDGTHNELYENEERYRRLFELDRPYKYY